MTALLGSRICHDLISPLGAIGNGVELLEMSTGTDSAELTLIRESVENANARIRLFRVAFGAPSPDQSISRTEVLSVLHPIAQSRKLQIDWMPDTQMSRDEARLIFLLLLCCETALPYGGRIAVDTGGGAITVTVDAQRLRQVPELWRYLGEADLPTPSASDIHFPLACHAATDLGRTITVTSDDNRIILRA